MRKMCEGINFYLRMEAMSPGSMEDEGGSPERHHRDDAETIDKLTKDKFRLQLRIYHMEEHMKQTQGNDWKSSMNVKLEVNMFVFLFQFYFGFSLKSASWSWRRS